jgi:Zn-dependent oligopeptidase
MIHMAVPGWKKEDDIKTENYKKNVQKLVDEWNKDMKPLIDQIDKIKSEIKQLEVKQVALQKKKPSLMSMRGGNTDDKLDQKLEELRKKGVQYRDKMVKPTGEFRRNLELQAKPDVAKLEKDKIEKLADWVKGVVQDGLPIGKNVKIPLGDLGFDFKRMRATSGTITFSIEF